MTPLPTPYERSLDPSIDDAWRWAREQERAKCHVGPLPFEVVGVPKPDGLNTEQLVREACELIQAARREREWELGKERS